VVRRCVLSRNLVNEGALPHWGGCRAKTNKTGSEIYRNNEIYLKIDSAFQVQLLQRENKWMNLKVYRKK